jgi:iron complex outermembrane receptor protein
MHLRRRAVAGLFPMKFPSTRWFPISFVLSLAPLSGADPVALPKEEPVEMLPFLVATEKDTGYTAADTISSGRLSTNLLMTPSATTVLTRDFLNDLGAATMVEASSWLTSGIEQPQGAVNGSSMNVDPGDSGVNTQLRGQSTQASTRNYFPSSTTPGDYNVERLEGAAGPNAILYGVGGAGGQINYITKRARGYNFARARLRTDTYGSLEGSLDLNRRLRPDLDVRYNAFWNAGRTLRDRVENNVRGHALSVVYRPWKKSELTVEADLGRSYRSWNYDAYVDNASLWTGAPVSGRLTAAQAAAAGLSIMAPNASQPSYWVWINGLGLMNWKGYGQTTGTSHNLYPADYSDTRGIPNLPRSPGREFNIAPEQVHVTADTKDIQASFVKSFDSGLTLELAYAYATIFQDGWKSSFSPAITGLKYDPNLLLPTGAPNPNFGKLYGQLEYDYNLDGTSRLADAERFAANYPIKLGRFGTQNLSLIVQHQQNRNRTRINRAFNANSVSPLLSANNVIYVFRYVDDPTPALPDLTKEIPMIRMVQDTDTTSKNTNDSATLATAGNYFSNRLSVIGGFRRERYTSLSGAIATRDAPTGAVTGYNYTRLRAMNNSASAGFVYFPLRVVGLSASYAEGFNVVSNPNPSLDGTYRPTAIQPARSFAAGLRFNFMQGKIVGSVERYETKQTSVFNVGVQNYNQALAANGQPLIPAGNAITQNISIADSQITEGSGWEGRVTASLARSFRLMANVALPDVKIIEQAPAFTAWYLAKLPTFEQWANNPAYLATDNRRTSARTAITSGQTLLNGGAVGKTVLRTYKARVNLFGNYTLQTGRLKGLRLGAGVQYFGKRVLGTPLNDPAGYVYAPTSYTATATTGYTFRLAQKRTIDLQLNVANLLDNTKPIFGGTAVYNNTTAFPNYYSLPLPRTYRLTSTITF